MRQSKQHRGLDNKLECIETLLKKSIDAQAKHQQDIGESLKASTAVYAASQDRLARILCDKL
jgi:hypothetical protein